MILKKRKPQETTIGWSRGKPSNWVYASVALLLSLAIDAMVGAGLWGLQIQVKRNYDEGLERLGHNLAASAAKVLDSRLSKLAQGAEMAAGLIRREPKLLEDSSRLSAQIELVNAGFEEEEGFRIFNASGRWVAGGSEPTAGLVDVSGRDYFKEAALSAGSGKLSPVYGRLAVSPFNGKPAVVVAFPIVEGGSFLGVATSRLYSTRFLDSISGFKLAVSDALSIRDTRTMSVLASKGGGSSAGLRVGDEAAPAGLSEAIRRGDGGGLLELSAADGSKWVSLASAARGPFVAVASMGLEDYYKPYRTQILAMGYFFGAFCLCTAALAVYLSRFAKALASSSSELAELNEGLERELDAREQQLRESMMGQMRQAQEREQVEKLAALGSMVAGVAHELNTPLGNALLTATSLAEKSRKLLGQFESDSPVRKAEVKRDLSSIASMADVLANSSSRAADLVRSFKQVAVDQTSGKLRRFDLRESLSALGRSFEHSLSAKSGMSIEIEAPAGMVCESYPGPLLQIATNMIQNAMLHAYAPDEKGVLRIGAEFFEASGRQWARVYFRDWGRGIPPDVRERIFEPYFTTKENDGGSGLGLALSRKLARQMLGGDLQLANSTDGSGTQFDLVFPRNAI